MKAAGLDGVVWWRRTQASLLAQLAVQKSSFAEQRRPSSWKMAPVPKLKPVIDINKYLRPISLTSVISKLAQDFVVALHFGPAALEVNRSKSVWSHHSVLYPTRPYLHGTCTWLQATHGSGAAVRVVPFDYRKAFDLSDHALLVRKVFGLSFPRAVTLWVADFLTHRQQRVKLSIETVFMNEALCPLVCLREPN